MKDSFGVGDGSGRRRRPQPGVRAGRDRAAEAAGDLVAAGERRRSRLRRRRRCSTGWSTASIRTGCPAAARPRRWRASRSDDLRQFHRQLLRAQQHDPGDRRRRDQRGSVRRRPSACSATGRAARCRRAKPIEPPPPTRRIVVVDKPDAVQTEIRVGQLAIPRKHPDYLAWDLAVKILGGEGANRLHRVLRSRARPDLRRVGRHRGDEAGRRLRRRDRHADRDDRRSAAADGRRVRASCSASASPSASSPTRRPIWPAASR